MARYLVLRGTHAAPGPSGPDHVYRKGDVIESDSDLAARDPQSFRAAGPARVVSPLPDPVPAAPVSPPPAVAPVPQPVVSSPPETVPAVPPAFAWPRPKPRDAE